LLNTINKRLGEAAYGKSRRKGLRMMMTDVIGFDEEATRGATTARYLPQTAQCPACERRDEAELLALKAFSQALARQDVDMAQALKESEGLCLLHLRMAMEAARNQKAFDLLVAITQEQLAVLIEDLDAFIRKNDHRFRDEKVTNEERESWRRALKRVVGPEREL
jgi:hypothetical protein